MCEPTIKHIAYVGEQQPKKEDRADEHNPEDKAEASPALLAQLTRALLLEAHRGYPPLPYSPPPISQRSPSRLSCDHLSHHTRCIACPSSTREPVHILGAAERFASLRSN